MVQVAVVVVHRHVAAHQIQAQMLPLHLLLRQVFVVIICNTKLDIYMDVDINTKMILMEMQNMVIAGIFSYLTSAH